VVCGDFVCVECVGDMFVCELCLFVLCVHFWCVCAFGFFPKNFVCGDCVLVERVCGFLFLFACLCYLLCVCVYLWCVCV